MPDEGGDDERVSDPREFSLLLACNKLGPVLSKEENPLSTLPYEAEMTKIVYK